MEKQSLGILFATKDITVFSGTIAEVTRAQESWDKTGNWRK